jgi:hypothetical protein
MNTSFDRASNGKDEWLTPPEVIRSLGEFDLDPCSPINRPWNTAKHHYTIEDDGYTKDWFGRVWCNPPYGNQTNLWLKKCSEYGNAVSLVFARTETKMFFDYIWDKADGLYFIKGRLKFHHVDGKQGDAAGAPSVLIAYGQNNVESLINCPLPGKFIRLR